jgi:hypothetical protein
MLDDIQDIPGESTPETPETAPTFDFSILVEPQGIVCRFQCAERTAEWTMPKTAVRRAHKAVPIGHVFDLLGAGPILGYELREGATNDPDFLMVPRAVNDLVDRVGKAIRLAQKAAMAKAAEEMEGEA